MLPFIKSLPTVWDETIVLNGSKIGELAAFARRKGNIWYVVFLNGGTEKRINCKLNFTGFKNTHVEFISDDLNDSKNVKHGSGSFKSDNVLNIRLAENGGYVAKITATN